jgi:hypothetical protein
MNSLPVGGTIGDLGLSCQEQRGAITLELVGYGTKTNSPWTAMWHGERSIAPVFGSSIPFDGADGTDLFNEALGVLPIRLGIVRSIRGRHEATYPEAKQTLAINTTKRRFKRGDGGQRFSNDKERPKMARYGRFLRFACLAAGSVSQSKAGGLAGSATLAKQIACG